MGKIVTVDFRNDTLFAVERDDGVFVAIKPISDRLGLKWSGQHDRLNRDAILAEGIRVIGIPSVGGEQDTTCLRLDLVNGWLFTIDESRVKDDERGGYSLPTPGGDQTLIIVSEPGVYRLVFTSRKPVAKDVSKALGIAWQGEKTLDKIKPEWRGVGKLPTPPSAKHREAGES